MKAISLLLLLLLCGCSGVMTGMIRGEKAPVQIHYKQGFASDQLTVVMPDGETYSGKAVMVGKSHSTNIGYASIQAKPQRGRPITVSGNTFETQTTYTGNVRAVLIGNRGGSMRCDLTYVDTGGETSAGGVGVCETADGQSIDVQW